MRTARFFLPLAMSIVLVGCDAWFPAAPSGDDAMMEQGLSSVTVNDDSMKRDDDSMTEDDAMMKDDDATTSDDGMMEDDAETTREPTDGSYGAYSPSVLANGQTKVLFFHAAWCPVCRDADAQLTAWYATHPFPLSTYKVDYDTEKELKQRYGVTYQHTFVLVDGEGKALKIMEGPSDAQLQELLRS